MNRVVRVRCPAAGLREELHTGIDPNAGVPIPGEIETSPETVLSLEEMFALRRDVFSLRQVVNENFKTLRDEWDN